MGDSNKCNLKSAVTLTYPPADGLDKNTYVKEPAVPDGYTMHAGTGSGNRNSPGYSGEGSPLISVLEGTTVPQCADACDQLPNCAGFTMLLDSNKCNLKSAVTLTYPPADGLDKNTYVKEPEPEPEATASPTAAPTAAPAVSTGARANAGAQKTSDRGRRSATGSEAAQAARSARERAVLVGCYMRFPYKRHNLGLEDLFRGGASANAGLNAPTS